ncbi:hypothetical protein C0Z16_12705 [Paraburkholderia rhynchosiae]|uniref:HTH araC/xylS-type domain-containing protein n=1 Tax=Paraburkholderia rhynchosiae TaxID=487049 RepID=A0ABX4V6D8_9BURK|nr:hypothetical protein C0Z16_12705 [Paraburkholderia rhynchosiae]
MQPRSRRVVLQCVKAWINETRSTCGAKARLVCSIAAHFCTAASIVKGITADRMRIVFMKRIGVTPTQYRERFRAT